MLLFELCPLARAELQASFLAVTTPKPRFETELRGLLLGPTGCVCDTETKQPQQQNYEPRLKTAHFYFHSSAWLSLAWLGLGWLGSIRSLAPGAKRRSHAQLARSELAPLPSTSRASDGSRETAQAPRCTKSRSAKPCPPVH